MCNVFECVGVGGEARTSNWYGLIRHRDVPLDTCAPKDLGTTIDSCLKVTGYG